MLTSDSIKDLVVAMGTAIGDVFNIEKLRYHKIIIATDADVDGAHIRTLLLTLFFRHFPKVIDGGFLYIAQPPLYKISKGKEVRYAYVEEEKAQVMKELGVEPRELEERSSGGDTDDNEQEENVENEDENTEDAKAKKSTKVNIQRYKGLGEMNPEELWETSMNPENRVLKQVTVFDAVEADTVFSTLMGTDVAARKSFIQSNAKLAQLDI